ncbi:hypothetical protein FRX31_021721 [Thalictrum thalictroides]|uniref:Uncharacterized protein n=1 Tax=Thalictrum thalictroides TaxID=46969 RepID=A0A7J6VV57_THATH|nr:hypothetical protein FRX31_021721 [Thalictrum thalictroides]
MSFARLFRLLAMLLRRTLKRAPGSLIAPQLSQSSKASLSERMTQVPNTNVQNPYRIFKSKIVQLRDLSNLKLDCCIGTKNVHSKLSQGFNPLKGCSSTSFDCSLKWKEIAKRPMQPIKCSKCIIEVLHMSFFFHGCQQAWCLLTFSSVWDFAKPGKLCVKASKSLPISWMGDQIPCYCQVILSQLQKDGQICTFFRVQIVVSCLFLSK